MSIVHRSRTLRLLAVLLLVLHSGAFTLHWEDPHVEACADAASHDQISWSVGNDVPVHATHGHDCLVCDLVLSGHGAAVAASDVVALAPVDAGDASMRPPARAPTHEASHRASPRGPPAC